MAKYERMKPQEKVTMLGSAMTDASAHFWICDEHGNRLAITWDAKHAERLADGLDVIEDLEHMEARDRADEAARRKGQP
jgi:hypothetical protein